WLEGVSPSSGGDGTPTRQPAGRRRYFFWPSFLPLFNSTRTSGAIFPPLITATLIVVSGSCARWNRNAATATAPLGSASVLGLAESRRVVSWISSSLTVTISST